MASRAIKTARGDGAGQVGGGALCSNSSLPGKGKYHTPNAPGNIANAVGSSGLKDKGYHDVPGAVSKKRIK